jgi:hypothetical protein
MFTNSDSRKQFRDSKVYNLRPLPTDGTHRRNPDEDFMLNGFGSNIKWVTAIVDLLDSDLNC